MSRSASWASPTMASHASMAATSAALFSSMRVRGFVPYFSSYARCAASYASWAARRSSSPGIAVHS